MFQTRTLFALYTVPCTPVCGFYFFARCSELILGELISDYLDFIRGVEITTGGLEKIRKNNNGVEDYLVLWIIEENKCKQWILREEIVS